MARKTAEEDLDALDLEDEDFEAEEDEESKAKSKGKKSSKKSDKPKGIGAREMAEHLGADPKTFRAWLRRKMAAGEISTLDDHEPKQRYDFGSSLKSNASKQIIALWESDSHEAGENLKKAQAAKKKKSSTKKKSS